MFNLIIFKIIVYVGVLREDKHKIHHSSIDSERQTINSTVFPFFQLASIINSKVVISQFFEFRQINSGIRIFDTQNKRSIIQRSLLKWKWKS